MLLHSEHWCSYLLSLVICCGRMYTSPAVLIYQLISSQSHIHKRHDRTANFLPSRILQPHSNSHSHAVPRHPLAPRPTLSTSARHPNHHPNNNAASQQRISLPLPPRPVHILHLPPLLQVPTPRSRLLTTLHSPWRRIRSFRILGVLPRRSETIRHTGFQRSVWIVGCGKDL
jgi:hypothetical protein